MQQTHTIDAQSVQAASSLPKRSRLGRLRIWHAVLLISMCAVVGVLGVLPSALEIASVWWVDALRSVGSVIPIASFVLILLAWRRIGWRMDGSWWGLAVLALTFAVVQVRQQTMMTFVVSDQFSFTVPPLIVVFFGYVSGIVLLFGGTRLYRASLFPVCLTVLLNPVPHIFNTLVDLPLQQASANVARSFAVALGQPLPPDTMQLMFTPRFGMFIAPGCNGIRGAVTLGLIALIAGYVIRLRPRIHALIVVGAVLLGYLCNFLRLCILVLYYFAGLRWHSLQKHGTNADYIIGGCIFLCVTYFSVSLLLSLKKSGKYTRPALPVEPAPASVAVKNVLPKVFAFLFLASLPATKYIGIMLHAEPGMSQPGLGHAIQRISPLAGYLTKPSDPNSALINRAAAVARLAPTIGVYHLNRSWIERTANGLILWVWGEYELEDGSGRVSLGISPVIGTHDPFACHLVKSQFPLWHELISVPTAVGPLPVNSSLYKENGLQWVESSTLCNGDQCGSYGSGHKKFRVIYSHPTAHSLMPTDPELPISVLLIAKTADTGLSEADVRQQMNDRIERFLAGANIGNLIKPFR